MEQEERLEYLLNYFKEESGRYKDLVVDKDDRRAALRALMNIRMPGPVPQEVLQIQDDFLRREVLQKGIVSWDEIPTIKERYGCQGANVDKIALWQGDITRLRVDAIVNAANSQMLGCFAPGHKCIDNAIHWGAGMMLREACHKYMSGKRQTDHRYEEPTGKAVVTGGYNLPSSHVIHTVGPIVPGALTDGLRDDLRACYRACLETAMEHELRTIAFCCISTGEFRFPNEEAAVIAYETIQSVLKDHGDRFDRIILNVFKDVDLKIYETLFK